MKFKLSADYALREDNNTYILYHIPSAKIYVLNDVGYTIINSIKQEKNDDEIYDIIYRSFDVEKGVLVKDIAKYVESLLARKILEVF